MNDALEALESSPRQFLADNPNVDWNELAELLGLPVPIHLIACVQNRCVRDGWLEWYARDSLDRALRRWLSDGWPVDGDAAGNVDVAQAMAEWGTYLSRAGTDAGTSARAVSKALRAERPPRGWLPVGPDDPILKVVFAGAWISRPSKGVDDPSPSPNT